MRAGWYRQPCLPPRAKAAEFLRKITVAARTGAECVDDRLCWDAGLTPGSVLGSIAETAYELGMDVSELMSALVTLPSLVAAEMARARAGSRRDLERLFRSTGPPGSTTRIVSRAAADPDLELEPIEEETIDFTRMLNSRLQRERHKEGSR